jgi:hypothetical protein
MYDENALPIDNHPLVAMRNQVYASRDPIATAGLLRVAATCRDADQHSLSKMNLTGWQPRAATPDTYPESYIK